MIPTVDPNRTTCAPCTTCRTCHFNACPALHGGTPERPGCAHNTPVVAQKMNDTEFAQAQHDAAQAHTRLLAALVESGRMAQDSDVVFSVTRVEVADEAALNVTVSYRSAFGADGNVS